MHDAGKPNLVVFAETLAGLAEENDNIYVVTSDSRGSGKLIGFGERFPDRIVEVGIAEQALVGVAAGLASTGKTVFAVSPASFLTARALEQIKNDVCYADNPVVLVGISAGVSYGSLGSTHHSLHDIAALRAIHNIDIISPADNFETREAVRAAATMSRPVYLRFGKRSLPHIHPDGTQFVPGHAIAIEDGTAIRDGFVVGDGPAIRDGADVAFIATGETVHPALAAATLLRKRGLSVRVLSMHTIKPIDADAVIDAAQRCRSLITVEEHCVHGGLGEAVAGILMQAGLAIPFRIVGIPDEYTVTGSQSEIYTHYGISAEGLAGAATALLNGEARDRHTGKASAGT